MLRELLYVLNASTIEDLGDETYKHLGVLVKDLKELKADLSWLEQHINWVFQAMVLTKLFTLKIDEGFPLLI